jgi:hypothetical protein
MICIGELGGGKDTSISNEEEEVTESLYTVIEREWLCHDDSGSAGYGVPARRTFCCGYRGGDGLRSRRLLLSEHRQPHSQSGSRFGDVGEYHG